MLRALCRTGLHGTGLNELLAQARARAPKGVPYHHFPGGKTELAVVAIEAAVEQSLARGFARVRDRLTDRLSRAGLEAAEARRFAALLVATYEGGLMQSRVAAQAAPLRDGTGALIEMLAARLDRALRR